jgi:hypothetical protein
VVVVHEIEYADIYGRVTLAEFLRLAGLVAAGAADPDDLAVEFARGEMTLTLSPDEFRCATSFGWYAASFSAYRQWMAADDVAQREDREMYRGKAVQDYHDLIVDAAAQIGERASAAAVELVSVPVARRLRLVQ